MEWSKKIRSHQMIPRDGFCCMGARACSIGECLKNQAGGSIFPPLRDNEVDDRYQID